MPNVIITGRIKEIQDAEIFGNFEKRTFWVEETTGQYPSTFALEMHQGNCNTLDNYSIGNEVTCQVDVRGRYWEKNGKTGVMNTLKCWKIERVNGQAAPVASQPNAVYTPVTDELENDDLPF